MAKLTLTTPQADQLALQDTDLQNAFLEGTQAPGFPDLMAPLPKYDTLKSEIQTVVKDSFKISLAALMHSMGLPGLTTTIDYRKSDGSTNGTLTFVNGILTAST